MQDQFIKERLYLKGVSPRTLVWYGCSFKAFAGALESKAQVLERIKEMRDRGVSPVTVNSYLRCLNAYFRWCYEERGQDRIRIPKLKEEQKVVAALTPEHVRRFLQWKPGKTFGRQRLHILICLLLDTGLRISEALGLRKEDVDFENFLLRVHGKGNKQRLVPFSHEMRRILWRYYSQRAGNILFGTRHDTQMFPRNIGRSVKLLGEQLGITGVRISPHTLRHTFALSYVRNGGDVFRLQRILGHSTLEMTRRYVNLQTADLQAVHDRLSPLAQHH